MCTRTIALALLVLGSALTSASADAPPQDFAFVQITDIHISPHLQRTGEPGPPRGAASIKWILGEAVGPQTISSAGVTTPAPAFALATGDLTEYGMIDDTWKVFERVFADFPYPLYVLPGNHDNTWVAMYQVMRRRHGGENYSFDKFGCHFACICSASPQEPVPTIDAKTRAWLRHDLDSITPGTPVFLALHHPPYSSEFAPAQYDTLIDLLRDYNVVLMLYGHGHGVEHRSLDGIDGVMGGSTFGKNAGYNLISVQDETLRVAYRYFKKPGKGDQPAGGPAWRVLFEKPLATTVPKRLFRIAVPNTKAGDPAFDDALDVVLELADGLACSDVSEVSIRIDGNQCAAQSVEDQNPGTLAWRVSPAAQMPGRHMLSVHLTTADGRSDLRTKIVRHFKGPDANPPIRWRREFPAAIKAGPVVVNDRLIVARTDGIVAALRTRTGRTTWTFATGGEVLGAPAWSGRLLVFGSGDGTVYAIDAEGKKVWAFKAGPPVYGIPLIAGNTVFVGDNGGRLHALDLDTGTPRWTFSRADYAIECRSCIWGDLVVFGAWDGYVYAVRSETGELVWKKWGPKSSKGKAARYYAPADCGPVVIDDKLLLCDRGYILGTYARDGSLTGQLDTKIAAVGNDLSGRSVYTRGTDNRICKLDALGKTIWRTPVEAGRFPIPPTCRGELVYTCSNLGLLSVLSASDGQIRRQFQVTPGFYVMAPVAVDDEGVCYVAGMDGTVTALLPSP